MKVKKRRSIEQLLYDRFKTRTPDTLTSYERWQAYEDLKIISDATAKTPQEIETKRKKLIEFLGL